MNVRWGVTANLTLNGTVNPDFSQVESDAGQFQFDPRQAVFYPEKRPFFLDGIEQFATPNNLIYTRRIVAPDFAAKLTGRVGSSTSLAVLSAVDDDALSQTGADHPVFTIARVQQDIGGQSKLGAVFTNGSPARTATTVGGPRHARRVPRHLRACRRRGPSAAPRDGREHDASRRCGRCTATRSGRRFGFRYLARGVDPDFRAGGGLHQPGRHRAGGADEPGARSTAGRAHGCEKLDERRRARRHVEVRRLRRRARRAGPQAALQQQPHAAGRLGGRRLGARRDLRLRRGPLRRLRAARHERRRRRCCAPSSARRRCRTSTSSCRPPRRSGAGSRSTAFVLWGKDENFYEWASADIMFGDVGARVAADRAHPRGRPLPLADLPAANRRLLRRTAA